MGQDQRSDDSQRPRGGRARLPLSIGSISWWDLTHTLGPILLASAAAIWLTLYFVRPAPPNTLTISSGPAGSSFALLAQRYRSILARSGITLKILPSEGSLQNLERMRARDSRVDIALVQAGIGAARASDRAGEGNLVSLGTMSYQPVAIFYHAAKPLSRLSQLWGKRIAIGKPGSGTHALALALLAANDVTPTAPTRLLDTEGAAARNELLEGSADAIFLTGDSTPPAIIGAMLHARGVRLFTFGQADAYVRRFPYLHRIDIPAGAFDLGENLPPRPITLLGPAVEVMALERESLGPLSPERREELLERLHEIERTAILRKIPGSHAEQLYLLREHIEFVRTNLARSRADAPAAGA